MAAVDFRGAPFVLEATRSAKEDPMKYVLLIHQGDAPTPDDPEGVERASRRRSGTRCSRSWQALNETPGVTPGQGLGAGDRDHGAGPGRPDAHHRRPVRRDQGGARRLVHLRGRRPRRGDRGRVADPGRCASAARSRCGRSRSGDVDAGLPRAVGSRARDPDRPPRRLRPRRGGRAGRVRDRGRALAARGRPGNPSAWLISTGAQPGDRP